MKHVIDSAFTLDLVGLKLESSDKARSGVIGSYDPFRSSEMSLISLASTGSQLVLDLCSHAVVRGIADCYLLHLVIKQIKRGGITLSFLVR